jgi:hypothetical protein
LLCSTLSNKQRVYFMTVFDELTVDHGKVENGSTQPQYLLYFFVIFN